MQNFFIAHLLIFLSCVVLMTWFREYFQSASTQKEFSNFVIRIMYLE